MATLKKAGNQEIEVLNTTLQITPLSDIFSKERIKSLGFPEDLKIVLTNIERLRTLKSPDGTVLAESSSIFSKDAKIVSQESLDSYFEKGIPFKSFLFEENQHDYHPCIFRKDAVENAKKMGAFKTEDDKKIYGGFISLHNYKNLENISELKSGNYEIGVFIKAPYRSISEEIIKLDENTFIGKAKHIYGTSYLNSDKYNMEEALPELIKQKNIVFIRESRKIYGSEFVIPSETTDFSRILTSTPHYNQNEAGDLMEASCYFLPPSEMIKAGIEWVKPDNVEDQSIGRDYSQLIDDFQNDPKYKGKFKYPCTEDIILVKHLGMLPFNKFEEKDAPKVEAVKENSLSKFL